MDFREAFIALNMIEGVGPVRARSLLEHFGDAPKILAASQAELLRVRNIGEDTAGKIAGWENSVDLAGELKRIAEFGCHVLISSDENYPALLREIYDPPLVLYVKGALTAKDKNAEEGTKALCEDGAIAFRPIHADQDLRSNQALQMSGLTKTLPQDEFMVHELDIDLAPPPRRRSARTGGSASSAAPGERPTSTGDNRRGEPCSLRRTAG